MTSEPWIGDENTGDPGICTYAFDEGSPHCGESATVHVLSESAIHGLVALPTCDRHASIARSAGPYLGEHRYGAACSAPKTLWYDDGCDTA